MKKLFAIIALCGLFIACNELPSQARVCASVDTTATSDAATFDECVDIEQVK